MKYLGKIIDNKDLVTKEYVDGSIPDVSDKQDVIEVEGILEGDGEGNISAAETQEVTTINVDSSPTANSSNLVTSGGVYTALQNASGGGGDIASTTSVLKGDGNGGAVAATAGTDYQAPLVAGTDYAEPSDIPTKVSDLQNDSGFISSYTETDPTVPSWAKASTKPTYTASEVGAAESSHSHGNITNGGDITATAPTVASGDQIIINDHSASKITNGPTFDGSTTSKYLSQKGTWENVPTVSYPVTSVNSKTGAVVLSNTDVGAAATSHTHGNIQNGGTLQTSDITIANGDKLVVTDSSDSSKVARASISFDGSTTSKYLSQKGTWENAPTAASIGALTSESDPVFGASAAAGISSTDISNWNAKQNALTIDSAPTNGSSNPVSSDGTYDMIMSRTKIYTASCSTAAGTAAKVATLDDSSGFSLTAGVTVAVRFTYGNSATTPTLRVDGSTTGTAKTIAVPSSTTAFTTGNGTTYNTWGAYETIIFTYNGTYWVNTGSALLEYLAYDKANSIVVPSAADAAPLMDGTATVGTSTDYAREDHVHPTDTSRAASSHTHGDITNTGDITATAPTITSGDKIIINDESASKITNGPSFGTSTTTYLRNDGSWSTPTDNRDPGYGKIQPGTASSSTSAIAANTTTAQASTYNETLTVNPGNKWIAVAGSNSTAAGSDTFTIGHSAGLTAKTSYGSTSTTASANGGSITVTDIKYDEAGHITASTDRTITLSQSTTPASHASTATTYGVGTSSNYGHVKLSDSTSSTSSTTDGIAATPAAVKVAYDLANGKQDPLVAGTDYVTPSSIPSASTTNPSMDGAASYGSGTDYARSNHVHPTDTSRAPLASPTFTGTPAAPTAVAGTNTTQIATTAFVGTALNNKITYGTEDLTAGTSALGTGVIYLVYE